MSGLVSVDRKTPLEECLNHSLCLQAVRHLNCLVVKMKKCQVMQRHSETQRTKSSMFACMRVCVLRGRGS